MNGASAAAGGTGTRGLGRPLLWSAAGHALALSACLVLGAGGSGTRLLPAVEVLLVAGEPGAGGPLRSGGAPGVAEGPLTAAPAAPPPGADARGTAGADSAPRPAGQSAPVPAADDPPGRAAPGPALESGFGPAGSAPSGAPPGADPVPARPAGEGPTAVAGAGPSPRAAEGDGGAGRRGEQGLLRERIQSRIVYPEEAIRRRLEGEVLLSIHVGAGGNPSEVRVARSSGARLLDDAARRGVVRAAPLPSSPGWVEVPVRFRLR